MSITWLTPTSPPHGLTEPEEMHIAQSETWGTDKITTGVTLKCAWDQRHRLMENLLVSAKAWPYHTQRACFAISGSIVPFPGEPGVRVGSGYAYDHAQLAVGFQSLNIGEGEDPEEITIFSESIEPSLEFMTLPPAGFYWDDTQTEAIKQEEAPGRPQYGMDYAVTFYKLKSIPAAALTLIGKSNSAQIVSPSLGLTFPIETLLFVPPKTNRNVTINGDNSYTMSCRYSVRPSGWNKFWRAKTQSFVSMYDDEGNVYKNFPPASFAGMVP